MLGLGMGTSSAIAQSSPRLTDAEVAQELQSLPNWTTDGQRIGCTFRFDNFVESVGFVNSLVEPAEAAGHHPDLQISYNRVTVSFTTHDVGGLTLLDFETARAIAHPCPDPVP